MTEESRRNETRSCSLGLLTSYSFLLPSDFGLLPSIDIESAKIMTQLTFEQFIHPLSEFPKVISINGDEDPMFDFYTMAGVILYTACANNNRKASKHILSTSAINAGMVNVEVLFERCKKGDRAAILQMISLIASGMETNLCESN
jgi:hypothetical protein